MLHFDQLAYKHLNCKVPLALAFTSQVNPTRRNLPASHTLFTTISRKHLGPPRTPPPHTAPHLPPPKTPRNSSTTCCYWQLKHNIKSQKNELLSNVAKMEPLAKKSPKQSVAQKNPVVTINTWFSINSADGQRGKKQAKSRPNEQLQG